jgi:hypothetical protein
MYVRGATIKGKLLFNILIGISSKLCDFFHFRDLIMSQIFLVVTGANCVQGNGLIKTV